MRALIAPAVGLAALAWILASVGLADIGQALLRAGWALPFMAAIHTSQLFLSAQAWRAGLGTRIVSRLGMFRIRWIREGVNSLLPTAQIGGQVAGVRLLIRAGLTPIHATAGIILDLTLEAAAQLIFTLMGIAILLDMRADRSWMPWITSGALLLATGLAGFILAQRAGLARLVEYGVASLSSKSPLFSTWSLRGLHDELMRLQRRPGALATALLLHTIGWALGGVEVWVALAWLGHPVTAIDAFVIESLGMAARSAGFAVPGAVGIQEGGFVLVAGLFGISVTDALALSVLKRMRELIIGAPALLTYLARPGRKPFFFEKKKQKTLTR